jgi:hypothetical protein
MDNVSSIPTIWFKCCVFIQKRSIVSTMSTNMLYSSVAEVAMVIIQLLSECSEEAVPENGRELAGATTLAQTTHPVGKHIPQLTTTGIHFQLCLRAPLETMLQL